MTSGGGVRQRPDGLWEGRHYADGRRRSVYGKTKREAQQKLRAALTAADNGIAPIVGRATVSDWLDEWMTEYVARLRRPRTVESYRDTCDRYIVPAIGHIPLTKLQPEDVQRMINDVPKHAKRGDPSPTTVRYSYTVLRVALGRALKSGKVARNVATLVDPPGKATPEMHPLTIDQVRTLVEGTTGDRLGALYAVAVGTGMRQGELLALRWSDLDLDAGFVTVRHTLERRTMRLAEPKTDNARRTLQLGSVAAASLREHRRRQLEERLAAGPRWVDRDLVFSTGTGGPLESHNVTHQFQATLRKLGLPRQRFHDLRHAGATMHLSAGASLFEVQRMLGHADIATTANVYGHVTRDMLARGADRMDAILAKREATTG